MAVRRVGTPGSLVTPEWELGAATITICYQWAARGSAGRATMVAMGKVSGEIDDGVREFLQRQHVFFVATAPSGAGGHVNLSPKGLDGFRIIGSKQVAYVDYTGSGVETIAHLRDNGRIVIMFCALEGPPKILRLHGRGRVIEPDDPEFA